MPLFSHKSAAVTSTPAQLVATSSRTTLQYVLVRAALANTQPIYLGASAAVNGTAGDANCGYPLRAGEAREFAVNEYMDSADETGIWAYAPSGTQYAHVEYK